MLDACEATVFYSLAFWAPNYLFSYKIAPSLSSADLALLPAILGLVGGSLLGGFFTDRLRKRIETAAAWVSFAAMAGGFVIALLLFNIFNLTWVMAAAFFFGLVGYMIFPSITVMMYDIVPPETKATVMASDGVLTGLVAAGASILIGLLSRQFGSLRLAFGGVSLFFLAAGAILAPLITPHTADMHDQENRLKRIEKQG
jgi:MFS family permease